MRKRMAVSGRFRVLHIIFMLSLCLGLFNVGKVEAQNIPEEFKPVDVFQIEWGKNIGQVGFYQGPGSVLGPQSFFVDEENKRIYITDWRNNRVLIYTMQGELLSHISTSHNPEDLCPGNKENLYVLYADAYKVIEYGLKGQVITTYPIHRHVGVITGIQFESEQGLFAQIGGGNTYPLMENGIKVSPKTQLKRKIRGLIRNEEHFFIDRKSSSHPTINILDAEGRTQKTVPIKDKKVKNTNTKLVGIDDYKNIYVALHEDTNKRYLRKYNPEGQLLAEATIPYSYYTYIRGKDLRVTGGGDVYQMLPIKKHVKILKWALGGAGMSPLSEESIKKLFSEARIKNRRVTKPRHHITVLSPKGGENWNLGEKKTIEWSDTLSKLSDYNKYGVRLFANNSLVGDIGITKEKKLLWNVGEITKNGQIENIRLNANYFVQVVRWHEIKGGDPGHVAGKSGPFKIISDTLKNKHKKYKNVVSLSFEYGSGDSQFGVRCQSEELGDGDVCYGPSAMATDRKSRLYVSDIENNRIKVFDRDGRQVSVIDTEDNQKIQRLAVDTFGHIYGYGSSLIYSDYLFKFAFNGSLLGKIVPSSVASSVSGSIDGLRAYNSKLYIETSSQKSYPVAMTMGSFVEMFEAGVGVEGIDGLFGVKRTRCKVEIKDENKAIIYIADISGNKSEISLDVEGIETISFVGEDFWYNIYLYVEKKTPNSNLESAIVFQALQIFLDYVEKKTPDSSLEANLYKIDRAGNILDIISLPFLSDGDKLSGGHLRPFASVNWEDGDIWKVTLGKDKVFIDKWSLIY